MVVVYARPFLSSILEICGVGELTMEYKGYIIN